MQRKTVCMVGGTGFIGSTLAHRLARRGYRIKVLTRRRERHRDLLVVPTLSLIEANVHDERDLLKHFEGCDAVINLAGILNETRGPAGEEFQQVHAELPRRIVSACRRGGVPRFLHMSALGASDDAPSFYQRSKAEGERAALSGATESLRVTSFRPSVVFGRGDSFVSLFAFLLRIAPGVMFLPTPQAQFKPVWVGDVADAFLRALDDPDTAGETYELCGPEVYTLQEIVEYAAELQQTPRKIVGLSDGLSKLQARILQRLPGKPYTMDNYLSSTVPNVCSQDGLGALGIQPTPMEAVVPGYIGPHHRQDRYQDFRREAGR